MNFPKDAFCDKCPCGGVNPYYCDKECKCHLSPEKGCFYDIVGGVRKEYHGRDCKCVSPAKDQTCTPNGVYLTSNPPQNKCARCGQTWFVMTDAPTCKNPKGSVSGEGWETELQFGILEDYIQAAENTAHVRDRIEHMRLMRKHFEKLKSFIRTERQKEYERGREEGKKLGRDQGSWEGRNDTLDEVIQMVSDLMPEGKVLNAGELFLEVLRRLKANRDI